MQKVRVKPVKCRNCVQKVRFSHFEAKILRVTIPPSQLNFTLTTYKHLHKKPAQNLHYTLTTHSYTSRLHQVTASGNLVTRVREKDVNKTMSLLRPKRSSKKVKVYEYTPTKISLVKDCLMMSMHTHAAMKQPDPGVTKEEIHAFVTKVLGKKGCSTSWVHKLITQLKKDGKIEHKIRAGRPGGINSYRWIPLEERQRRKK